MADKKDTHVTKDGRTVKKGLYYYMNKRKKAGTSRKGKGTVTDKALKQSAKTAKKTKKKKKGLMQDETAIYLILRKIRERKEDLKEVIAAGLPSWDEYNKTVGEYKAYAIIEQEIQDLQKDEENNDGERIT